MYDAIVIGGGPGGYVCAIRLAQLGKKAALVEKEYLGGTCTNWGCIPTKAMLSSAHLYTEIKEKSKRLGVEVGELNYRLDGIMAHMKRTVTTSRKGIELLLKKNGVDFFNDLAIIKDSKNVLLESRNEVLNADNLVIAGGSEPSLFPPFDSIAGLWTSDDIFKLAEMPSSVAIVGGGVIGVEFGTFFGTLGVKTTIIELADHILPYEDSDVADEIRRTLKKKGVAVMEGTKVISVETSGESFHLVTQGENSETIEVDKVLVAIGRKARISDDIRSLGVEIRRGVVTDKRMKTNMEGVYAIGDIRAEIMLAHVASYEGIVAAHNIAGQEMLMDYSAVPSIIFSSPEVASTGLRESEIDDSSSVKISKFPLAANGRARTMLENTGFAKVIAESQTGKILGASIVSPSATDLIMEAVVAVKNGLTVEQLENSIHPHPTLTETVLGALEGIEGMSIHS